MSKPDTYVVGQWAESRSQHHVLRDAQRRAGRSDGRRVCDYDVRDRLGVAHRRHRSHRRTDSRQRGDEITMVNLRVFSVCTTEEAKMGNDKPYDILMID